MIVQGQARADAIVVTRAMTASTIAEIFIEPETIRTELEIGLKDSESYGLDWIKIFESGEADIGVQGLATPGSRTTRRST